MNRAISIEQRKLILEHMSIFDGWTHGLAVVATRSRLWADDATYADARNRETQAWERHNEIHLALKSREQELVGEYTN
jgi:hypothetical protein